MIGVKAGYTMKNAWMNITVYLYPSETVSKNNRLLFMLQYPVF